MRNNDILQQNDSEEVLALKKTDRNMEYRSFYHFSTKF